MTAQSTGTSHSIQLPLAGGCLCGQLRFEVTEAPTVACYCHCTRCQGRTGSGSSAQALVPNAAIKILAGEEALRGWGPPDGGRVRQFCGECGAHLFSREPDGAGLASVRMSAFDTDPGVRPTWRQMLAYAATWETIPDDGLPRYDERGPVDPRNPE